MVGATRDTADNPINEPETGPEEKRKTLVRRLLETDFDKKDRMTKVFQFFLPWVVLLILIIITVTGLYAFTGDWHVSSELLYGWTFYIVPPLGKETIIPTRVKEGVPGWLIGFAVTAIDILYSLFLIWNYDWVKNLPKLGRRLERFEEKGRNLISRFKGFRTAAFLATTVFVLIPATGSGGFGGTILGRLIGMKPYKVLLAVSIGSIVGSFGYAIVSESIITIIEGSTFFMLLERVSIFHILAVVIVAGLVWSVMKNPKKAVMNTTTAVDRGIELTERAIIKSERRRKEATKRTVNGTKRTIMGIGTINRKIEDVPIRIATRPLESIGPKGKRMAERTKEKSRQNVDRARRLAGRTIDTSLEVGIRTGSLPFELATEATLEGLEVTREGVEGTKELLIRTTEDLDERTRKVKEAVRKMRTKKDEKEKKGDN